MRVRNKRIASTPEEKEADKKFRKALGKVIRRLRKKIPAVSQDTIAHKAKVTQVTISLLENGNREVSVPTLRKVTLALGEKLSTVIAFTEHLLETEGKEGKG